MEEVKCYIPKTLKEALEIKAAHDVIPLAGGSDLMVAHKKTIGLVPEFEKPVMIIRNLSELKGISVNDKGECVIGAGCTAAEIAADERCPWHLRQAASRMGAIGLRNSATVAGNIANASPKGDTPGPLYLLDARVRIASLRGEREEKVSDFIVKFREIDLKQDELITQIIVPLSEDDFDYIFWHKVGTRKANAISKITVSQAIRFADDGKTVADYRLSATATGAMTNRSRNVENLLIGKEICDKTIEDVVNGFDAVISPRAMPEFRREATRRMIRRFLSEAARRPQNKVIDTYDDYHVTGQPEPRECRHKKGACHG
ncbi:MAG: FAD binding domain-containing protein [Spirochaetales bacterium]|nr:FAD binding domain-containing protein [Spirochaetales bacterium]